MSDPAGTPDFEIDAMAQLDFRPLEERDGAWTPPTNDEWSRLANPHLISVRLAWLSLHKSKAELVAMAEQLGDAALTELVTQIGLSADWFEGLHKILASAECRIMCAYAAASMEADRTS
ncbi:MAG: hypothetical protein EON58_04135 [Alphaproteobacteria bacterium]|nr:MAG: hypothetical protein EON58_04135 [Alphaproteobacteria bacterium]